MCGMLRSTVTYEAERKKGGGRKEGPQKGLHLSASLHLVTNSVVKIKPNILVIFGIFGAFWDLLGKSSLGNIKLA